MSELLNDACLKLAEGVADMIDSAKYVTRAMVSLKMRMETVIIALQVLSLRKGIDNPAAHATPAAEVEEKKNAALSSTYDVLNKVGTFVTKFNNDNIYSWNTVRYLISSVALKEAIDGLQQELCRVTVDLLITSAADSQSALQSHPEYEVEHITTLSNEVSSYFKDNYELTSKFGEEIFHKLDAMAQSEVPPDDIDEKMKSLYAVMLVVLNKTEVASRTQQSIPSATTGSAVSYRDRELKKVYVPVQLCSEIANVQPAIAAAAGDAGGAATDASTVSTTMHRGEFKSTPISIKIWHGKAPLGVSTEIRREMENEALIMMVGSPHSNIVSVLGICCTMTEAMLLIEDAEYGSLFNVLQSHVSFPAELIVAWMVDICSALQAIHFLNIRHGDVKPENMMLFKDRLCCKLSGFGYAETDGDIKASKKECFHTAAAANTTAVTAAVGSGSGGGSGMPPSKESDVQSFGFSLLFMLLRKPVVDIQAELHKLAGAIFFCNAKQHPDRHLFFAGLIGSMVTAMSTSSSSSSSSSSSAAVAAISRPTALQVGLDLKAEQLKVPYAGDPRLYGHRFHTHLWRIAESLVSCMTHGVSPLSHICTRVCGCEYALCILYLYVYYFLHGCTVMLCTYDMHFTTLRGCRKNGSIRMLLLE